LGSKQSLNSANGTPKKTVIKAKPARSARAAPAAGPTSTTTTTTTTADIIKQYKTQIQQVTEQMSELKTVVDQVEKEREFYFGKLREIEVYVQMRLEGIVDGDVGGEVEKVCKDVQAIMYKVTIIDKTEDGFETPEVEV
jgi:microtubule-associated protein, RP/EB family